jgi:creatinine amidohydrolase
MAVMLAIDENLVRTESIESRREGDISPTRLPSEGFESFSENGVLGDPTRATTEAGEVIVRNVVETYVERIRAERDAARSSDLTTDT